MPGRRVAAVAGAVAVLLLGGCSAASNSRDSSATAAGGAAMPAATAQPTARGASAAAAGPAVDAGHIAYTAQLTVEVPKVQSAADTARSAAETVGGYVAAETVTGAKGDNTEPQEARLTLRVPSASHQQSLDRLSGLGHPLALTSQADDVTQQVIDVDSRVKTQQASVDRVRGLMTEAKSLSDVVSLEGELSRREADLESLQQQQRALAARTSMSTIALDLVREDGKTAAAPAKRSGFWASIGGALENGWHVLVAVVKGLLVGLAAAAPFLVVLAPLAWFVLRRRRRQQSTATAVEQSSGQ